MDYRTREAAIDAITAVENQLEMTLENSATLTWANFESYCHILHRYDEHVLNQQIMHMHFNLEEADYNNLNQTWEFIRAAAARFNNLEEYTRHVFRNSGLTKLTIAYVTLNNRNTRDYDPSFLRSSRFWQEIQLMAETLLAAYQFDYGDEHGVTLPQNITNLPIRLRILHAEACAIIRTEVN